VKIAGVFAADHEYNPALVQIVQHLRCALAHRPGVEGLSGLGMLCKLSTFSPTRGPSARR